MPYEAVQALVDRVAERRRGDCLWYCELIIGLAACNHGEFAGLVYKKAIALAPDQQARRQVWSRVREALLKGVFALGQARLLAAELALFEALDPNDVDQAPARRDWTDNEHGKMKAVDWLTAIGGTEFCERFVSNADANCPDLSHYLITLSVGHVMTEDRVLSMVETEKLVLIALTAQGVAWWTPSHYRALIRLGGTKQTAHDANSMALEIAATFGLAVQGTANIDELCQSAA